MKKKLLVFAALLVLALVCASVASAVPQGTFVDWGDLDMIADVDGHPAQNWVIDYEPTCEEPGKAHFVCDVGDTTHTHFVYLKPLGHLWSSENDPEWGRVIEEPSCTTEGYAIDVCVRDGCDAEDWFHQRKIDKKPHEYDMTDMAYYNGYAEEIIAPSCGEHGEGKAWRTCIYCGVRMPEQADKSHLAPIFKIDHDWSDWRIDEPSTCLVYGKVSRTCIACGATQYLDESAPVYDQGVPVYIWEVEPLKNPLWNTDLDGKEFTKQSDLENALEDELFEYEPKKNWLADCYTRKITYTCPYCHGTEHKDFTVTLVNPATIAHIWNAEPDEVDSVAPTCTEAGYDIYYCIYDEEGIAHGHTKDDQWYKVELPALGHDWGEWIIADKFEKEGEIYAVSYRTCLRDGCGKYEQKTEKWIRDGFIEDENGLRLWNNDVPSTASGFIYVKQEDNWFVLEGGYLAEDYTGFQNKFGRQWMVVNGELDKYNDGLVNFNGGVYAISEGMLWNEWNGIHWLGDEAYLLQNGQWLKGVNRVMYEGSYAILITDGKVDHDATSWTDPVTGETYQVINGIIQGY